MNVMRTQHHSRSSSGSTPERTHTQMGATVHVPVLLQAVLAELDLKVGEPACTGRTVLDGTLGGGGHAVAMAQALGATGTLIGLDADSVALSRARAALETLGQAPTLHLVQENFRNFDTALTSLKIAILDAALFDLGLSSDQLEVSGRGFTFKHDEPLIMTLSDNKTPHLTAQEIVNEWSEESIADIIYGYGGERYARRIAKAIVVARATAPITHSAQLAELVKGAVPMHARYGRIHPATKTFQALRITVNDELGAVRDMLDAFPQYTHTGSRIAIITFHSLEDRLVKRTFREWQARGLGAPTTKKPIIPTDEELVANPRARSAKLRVFTFN